MVATGKVYDYHAKLIVDILNLRPEEEWMRTPLLTICCPCIERVMKLLPEYKWDPSLILKNNSYPKQKVLLHSNVSEIMYALCSRRDFTLGEILSYARQHPEIDMMRYSHALSTNGHIVKSYDEVLQNIDIPWTITGFLINPNIRDDKRYLELLESYMISFASNTNHQLSVASWYLHTSVVPLDIIKRNPQLPWNESILKYRTNLLHDLDASVHYADFGFLLETLVANPDLPWDWTAITNKSEVTLEVVAKYPHLPWNKEVMARKYCTVDDIRTRPKDWMPAEWRVLYEELFTFKKEIEEFAVRHMAAWRIQRAFLKAYYNPNMLICQRRIKRWN